MGRPWIKSEYGEKLADLFDELVPASGPAETVAGELVRAVNRIIYRYFNDGDIIDVGYGKETCNAPARYISEIADGSALDYALYSAKALHDDWLYEKALYRLAEETVKYIEENPQLKQEKNETDMWEFMRDSDKCWEEEEEVYEPFELFAVYDPD